MNGKKEVTKANNFEQRFFFIYFITLSGMRENIYTCLSIGH